MKRCITMLCALAALTGCPSGACPSGFTRTGDLCIQDVDASDASGGDASASDAGHDAPAIDAHVPCSGACSGTTPHCMAEVCVGCRDATDCAAPTSICDPTRHACVGCTSASDCTDPRSAVCDLASSTCGPCVTSGDCAHVTGRGICASGACVACTPSDESACGANSCDPATGSCTTTPRASVNVCGACVADSECMSILRCVPLSFAGVARPGGFCLVPSSSGCGACSSIVSARASLSGAAAATYCGPDESVETCESVVQGFTHPFDAHCSTDADCGAAGLDDGRCGAGGTCVVRCAMSCECPSGSGYTCHADHFCS